MPKKGSRKRPSQKNRESSEDMKQLAMKVIRFENTGRASASTSGNSNELMTVESNETNQAAALNEAMPVTEHCEQTSQITYPYQEQAASGSFEMQEATTDEYRRGFSELIDSNKEGRASGGFQEPELMFDINVDPRFHHYRQGEQYQRAQVRQYPTNYFPEPMSTDVHRFSRSTDLLQNRPSEWVPSIAVPSNPAISSLPETNPALMRYWSRQIPSVSRSQTSSVFDSQIQDQSGYHHRPWLQPSVPPRRINEVDSSYFTSPMQRQAGPSNEWGQPSPTVINMGFNPPYGGRVQPQAQYVDPFQEHRSSQINTSYTGPYPWELQRPRGFFTVETRTTNISLFTPNQEAGPSNASSSSAQNPLAPRCLMCDSTVDKESKDIRYCSDCYHYIYILKSP